MSNIESSTSCQNPTLKEEHAELPVVGIPRHWNLPVVGNLFRPDYKSLLEQAENIVSFDKVFKVCGIQSLSDNVRYPPTLSDIESAVRLVEQARPLQEEALGLSHPDVIRSLRALGRMNTSIYRYDRAITFIEAALERSDNNSLDYSRILGDLNKVHQAHGSSLAGRYTLSGKALNQEKSHNEKAMKVLRRRAKYLSALHQSEDPKSVKEMGDCFADLAALTYVMQNYLAAEKFFTILRDSYEDFKPHRYTSKDGISRMLRWTCESLYGASDERTREHFIAGWGQESYEDMKSYFEG